MLLVHSAGGRSYRTMASSTGGGPGRQSWWCTVGLGEVQQHGEIMLWNKRRQPICVISAHMVPQRFCVALEATIGSIPASPIRPSSSNSTPSPDKHRQESAARILAPSCPQGIQPPPLASVALPSHASEPRFVLPGQHFKVAIRVRVPRHDQEAERGILSSILMLTL
jgi:hypothetical protein